MNDTPFPPPITEDLSEQSIRERRWREMMRPLERATGRAQWVKRPIEGGGAAVILQHEWVVSEWGENAWVSRKEWRDVPVVDE